MYQMPVTFFDSLEVLGMLNLNGGAYFGESDKQNHQINSKSVKRWMIYSPKVREGNAFHVRVWLDNTENDL